MTFKNSVVGGTTLVRPAIKSPNYVAGSAGWTINVDGSAEFNNITIRGGTTVGGTSLYYNGTPAAGNLIASITASSGTDSFGNAYLAGITTYATDASGRYTQMQDDGELALGYTSQFANAGLLSATGSGITLVTPYTSSAPNNDPTHFTMHPGGITGVDRGYAQLSTLNGLDILSRVYGKLEVLTQETTTPGVLVDMVSGTTADPLDLQVNADSKFTVNENGDCTVYSNNTFTTYTPTVTGGGAVTWTTQTGWWVRVGKMIFFTAYLVVNGAGSGATAISIDGPVNIDRTTRQTVGAQADNITAANEGSCQLVSFTGGSGATFDRLRDFNNNNVTGADLLAGALITVTGWYREA